MLFLSVLDPAKSESEYPIKLHVEFLGYHNPKFIVPNRYLMILLTALKCDCLGHGSDECDSVPKAVEALSNVKAIHVVAGDYTTFVVFDDGDVYSFGCGQSASLGHNAVGNDE